MAHKIGIFGMLLSAVILTSFSARAEEVVAGSQYDESKEAEVVQVARRRLYIGGRDEGDLTVQSQLQTPTRKISPQVEGAHESTGED